MDYHQENRVQARARILLVDDLPLNRATISAILHEANFEAKAVCCADLAYAAVREADYDLILLDIRMPYCNGYDAAARLRQREGGREGPSIVALSALPEDVLRSNHARSGMDGYIARPIAPNDLISRIETYLSDRPAATSCPAVWDQGAYDRLVNRLGRERVRSYLDTLLEKFDVLHEILATTPASRIDLAAEIHDLRSIAGTLGFEEILTVCSNIQKASHARSDRDFKQNLVGALRRAVHAAIVTFRGSTLLH